MLYQQIYSLFFLRQDSHFFPRWFVLLMNQIQNQLSLAESLHVDLFARQSEAPTHACGTHIVTCCGLYSDPSTPPYPTTTTTHARTHARTHTYIIHTHRLLMTVRILMLEHDSTTNVRESSTPTLHPSIHPISQRPMILTSCTTLIHYAETLTTDLL